MYMYMYRICIITSRAFLFVTGIPISEQSLTLISSRWTALPFLNVNAAQLFESTAAPSSSFLTNLSLEMLESTIMITIKIWRMIFKIFLKYQ